MEIYNDTKEQKAILICNASELHDLVTSLFFGAEHFRKEAEKSENKTTQEINFDIVLKLAEMHDKIAKHIKYDMQKPIEEDFIEII